jgi:hypothetical protein
VLQLLVNNGEITKEESRLHPLHHVLLNCIGLMLSTDGLHDALPDADIESIFGRETDLKESLNDLASAALLAGGRTTLPLLFWNFNRRKPLTRSC